MLFLLEGILEAKTAFMIGQGTDESSDSDVLRNARLYDLTLEFLRAKKLTTS